MPITTPATIAPMQSSSGMNTRGLLTSTGLFKWQFLYFFPLPHEHGSLRPNLGAR